MLDVDKGDELFLKEFSEVSDEDSQFVFVFVKKFVYCKTHKFVGLCFSLNFLKFFIIKFSLSEVILENGGKFSFVTDLVFLREI